MIQTARRTLSRGGRLVLLYPSQRLAEAIAEMKSFGIEPKFLRIVYSSPMSKEAKLAIVYGARGGKPGIHIHQPFFIYGEDGSYSDEAKNMFKAPKE